MAAGISADVHYSTGVFAFVRSIGSPGMERAAAFGLNEHVAEQRRQSVTRIVAFTGVPSAHVGRVTTMRKAGPGAAIEAAVITKDAAIGLHTYGAPVWTRDLNPMADGERGGSVSSMAGAQATAWNVRRTFKRTFMVNGRVVVRSGKGRFPLKTLSSAVLANELAKPSRPNVPAAQSFAQMDLERRVTRHVIRFLGTS